jgi:DNA-binding NarL/FixJ family response regulator
VVAADITHEEAHTSLMRLYALLGQNHRAMRQFRQLQKALRRELDVEPQLASRDLFEAIKQDRRARSVDLSSNARVGTSLTEESLAEILSGRQRQVTQLLGRGLTDAQIAAALSITRRTAETHISQILRKLGLSSRSELGKLLVTNSILILLSLTDSADYLVEQLQTLVA